MVGVVAFFSGPAPTTRPRPEPIATVRQTLNAQWAPGTSRRATALFPVGCVWKRAWWISSSGNGTVAILKGPVDVDLRGVDSAFLHSGQMLVRVAHETTREAKFQVETPTSQLVDVGTEFGVEVEDDGSSLLQVYEGEVLASAKVGGCEGTAARSSGRSGAARRLGARDCFLARALRPACCPDRAIRTAAAISRTTAAATIRSRSRGLEPALTIDADLSDWDLTHRIRSECEPPYADNYYLEAAMMYDEEFLYVGAHVGDPHPMRNQYSAKEPFDKHGMGGAVALRVSTDRQAGWPLNAERARTRRDTRRVPPTSATNFRSSFSGTTNRSSRRASICGTAWTCTAGR